VLSDLSNGNVELLLNSRLRLLLKITYTIRSTHESDGFSVNDGVLVNARTSKPQGVVEAYYGRRTLTFPQA